jgi:hypothetical protein
MSISRALGTLCIFAVFGSGWCLAQSKVEPGTAITDASVSDAVKKVLEPKSHHVVLEDGSTYDIWLRDKVPAQSKDVAGALYPQLAESTLVAVIAFAQASTDYRGQPIKAGLYTLRYELIPEDGNHLGVSENRDFLLLIPAGGDADPEAVMKFDDLVVQSRKATGSQHPAPISLVQAGSGPPAVTQDDSEHWVFSAGLKLASGQTIPLGMVIKGTAPQ